MAERLFHSDDPEAQAVPEPGRKRAIIEGKQIKQIIWDEASGFPQSGWGFVQWSLRSYKQR